MSKAREGRANLVDSKTPDRDESPTPTPPPRNFSHRGKHSSPPAGASTTPPGPINPSDHPSAHLQAPPPDAPPPSYDAVSAWKESQRLESRVRDLQALNTTLESKCAEASLLTATVERELAQASQALA
eukprot:CAMPEP_0114162808 /NCGR_PEP_ID=MMETSP0043_2-20121206/29730_1 /TAXON_ID=464988 /ORGANISM="Hemiselmis andersenii, Strain CCMP644" /LENGTH=127 /DNA_ID=CAMNT_0001259223 /DNA_START=57 /DNA_END=436 /DNA_ORIENTATION=+